MSDLSGLFVEIRSLIHALMLLSVRQWDNKERHSAERINTGARCKVQGIRQWAMGKTIGARYKVKGLREDLGVIESMVCWVTWVYRVHCVHWVIESKEWMPEASGVKLLNPMG